MDCSSTCDVRVTGGGDQVAAHGGLFVLGRFADGLGLGEALSAVVAPGGERAPVHDRGKVLVHALLMLAGGGEACSDIEHLRAQPVLFGRVASDSTLVEVHSENKAGAAAHFKAGFGFHPMLCATSDGEPLSIMLRPGNAAANNIADHIDVLDAAPARDAQRRRRLQSPGRGSFQPQMPVGDSAGAGQRLRRVGVPPCPVDVALPRSRLRHQGDTRRSDPGSGPGSQPCRSDSPHRQVLTVRVPVSAPAITAGTDAGARSGTRGAVLAHYGSLRDRRTLGRHLAGLSLPGCPPGVVWARSRR